MSEIRRSATISDCGSYRYVLLRTWDERVERLKFIMLNPSTADGTVDDPTIRRCMGFARSMGYGGITVANLYAGRATKPKDLWRMDDPVGPDNDEYLARVFRVAADMGSPVIAAWGANAKPQRVAEVLALPHADRLHALGVTKDGAPRHPLYLRADSLLEPWPATRPPLPPTAPEAYQWPDIDVAGEEIEARGDEWHGGKSW